MDIREAIEDIMGERLASSIIADMGIHWAVIGAMCDPRANDRPTAVRAIREWQAEQKARS